MKSGKLLMFMPEILQTRLNLAPVIAVDYTWPSLSRSQPRAMRYADKAVFVFDYNGDQKVIKDRTGTNAPLSNQELVVALLMADHYSSATEIN